MVTRPAVPPYSSMTMAMWVRARLHLAQQLVDRLGLGHEASAARISSSTSVGRRPLGVLGRGATRSLR